MGIFRPRQPAWVTTLLSQNQQILKGITTIMSEDAAVEQDVSEINTDVTALTALIASLKNVSVGDTITAQTKADLDAAVAALGNLVPPPPAPPSP
jgi:hypothetical protein